MSLSVGTVVPTHRALGVCQLLITITESAFFTEMCISIATAVRLLYWDACHQQICNHGGSQRAGRVADAGLLGLSLSCHRCGCPVLVSSAV